MEKEVLSPSTLASKQGVTPGEIGSRWALGGPLGRVGQPKEFANLVVFLAMERACCIAGASIAVDGGSLKELY